MNFLTELLDVVSITQMIILVYPLSSRIDKLMSVPSTSFPDYPIAFSTLHALRLIVSGEMYLYKDSIYLFLRRT